MAVSTRARVLTLSLIAMIVATLAVPTFANDEPEVFVEPDTVGALPTGGAEVIGSNWFIQLASSPAVKGTSRAALAKERDALRDALRGANVSFKERFAFETLWNGLSVEVAPSDLGAIGRLRGVTGVYPVATVSVPSERSDNVADLATALAQTGADAAQADGWSGAGIRVAIMDTGIDYHHPDLGGCFGTGCRVVTGRDFVGDGFNASGSTAQQLVARPDNDPDDCNGHGTHVAGIVGASGDPATGGARGVAPAVTFGAYRVFGCEGSTTADIMIAAMERALADGMHVLNMSIGSAFQWPTYPTAVAASNLVDAGMVVVASIGNSGANGVYSTGAPGNGDKVIGVASFDNTHIDLRVFTITPDGQEIGYQQATAAPAAPTSGSASMARTGTQTSGDDACAALPAGSLAGKVALIRRGFCTFHLKSLNAQNAGAIGVVLYNNSAGRFSATVAGTPAITVPVVSISNTEGNLIDSRLATGPVTMTWTDGTGTFVNPTGNLISSFSSYGHAPDLALKPDIGAPGGLIRSTWPLEAGGYATISGTSMSSPHVAGAAALVLQARPGTTSQDMRALLQNSADPKVWFGSPTGTFIENVHRQGAGMLDIPGAIASKTSVTPGKIALGESVPTPSQIRQLTITNNGAAPATYTFSHTPALATGPSTADPSGTFVPGFFIASATVTLPGPVTLPAGGSATVNVTINAPTGTGNRQYGGYIVVSGGGQTHRVPYAGFRGDYQSISALNPGSSGFPWLARRVATTALAPVTDWQQQSAGAVYTLKHHTDAPWVLWHLGHQVSRVTLDVYNADGTLFGTAFDATNFRRSATNTSASTGFFALQWTGKAASPNGPNVEVVKNGSYYFKLTVVKALGDPANPAHVQSWTSPTFVINREIEEP